MKKKLLSIIIPVYNEQTFVYQLLEKVAVIQFSDYEKEIVIINDWSADNSENEIMRFLDNYSWIFSTYHKQNNTGKWWAIKKGITLAQWDVFIIQDADLEYEPTDIEEWLSLINDNNYVVYGSRIRGFKRHGFTYSTWPFLIWWLAVSWLASVLSSKLITDEPTCYKMFHKDCKPRLLMPQENWFEREPAITMLLLRKWFSYAEWPIRYYPRKVTAWKKIKLKDGFKALWTLVKRRFKKIYR